MNPLVILVGLVGGGFAASKLLKKPQGLSVVGAGGVPVRIITPLSAPTPGQLSGISTPAAPHSGAVAHQAASGIIYAPAKSLVVSPDGVQPPPIVQTPTGSSSIAIVSLKDVQHALNTLGFQPLLKEDGILGPKTSANVRAFQSKQHLAVDGNAGPATKAALSNALVALASGGSPVVAPDPTKPAARLAPQYNDDWAAPKGPPTASDSQASAKMSLVDIQRALNLLGANPHLAEDGKSGAGTVAAIKSFQLAHGLAVDGIAGPKTKAVLYQLEHAPVKQFTGEFAGNWC